MASYEDRINAIMQKVKEMEARQEEVKKENEETNKLRDKQKALIRGKFTNYVLSELEQALKWNKKINKLTIAQTKKLKNDQEVGMLFYKDEDYETIFEVETYYQGFNNKEYKEKSELPPLILGVESYEELIQSFKKDDEETDFNEYTALGGFLKIKCSKEKITVTPNYTKK